MSEALTSNDRATDAAVLAAARAITTAALDLIYADPHQWSIRGCATCRAVSALIGKPFGCDRYQIQRSERK